MLSIAHGSTGALIASKIPNPFISIPLVIAAHFAEDRVPHWDVGTGITSGRKSKKQAFLQELFFDFPLSALLVYFLFQAGRPFYWQAWLGWFVGLLPDFLEFPLVFLNIRIGPLDQLAKLHEYFHHSIKSKFWGLLPQFFVILLVILLR